MTTTATAGEDNPRPGAMSKRFGRKMQEADRSPAVAAIAHVGDTPVLDTAHFPEFKVLEDNWRDVLDEVREILKFREQVPKVPRSLRVPEKDLQGRRLAHILPVRFRNKARAQLRQGAQDGRHAGNDPEPADSMVLHPGAAGPYPAAQGGHQRYRHLPSRA